jgi:periplasmic divalent cation tolerance protein
MPDSALLVFCTCPDRATAQGLAQTLVESGLAACVNLIDGVTSVYPWRGRIEQSLAKTMTARYPELERVVRARHPYELPEIIAVPIQQGLPEYLQWVESCTSAGP